MDKLCKIHCTSYALCTTNAKMIGETAMRLYELSSHFGCRKSIQSPTLLKIICGFSAMVLIDMSLLDIAQLVPQKSALRALTDKSASWRKALHQALQRTLHHNARYSCN